MVARTGSWADFKVRLGDDRPDDDRSYDELTLRLFTTPDGKEWLQRTLQARLMQPQVSGSDFMEGRREELREITRVMARARAAIEKKVPQAS